MRLLAIETSTDLGSAALWVDGALLERFCPAGRPHSETLLPLIQELLAEAGGESFCLDGVAFGAGPGAFTGLRVACGLAQGLATGIGCPVVPVGSLAAVAHASGADRCFAAMDARMGEAYVGLFERSGARMEQRGTLRVQPPAAIEFPPPPCRVAGNALAVYPALAERAGAAGLSLDPQRMPTAAAIAALAVVELQAGRGLDPALAAPLYVRDKVAQTIAERLATGGKA